MHDVAGLDHRVPCYLLEEPDVDEEHAAHEEERCRVKLCLPNRITQQSGVGDPSACLPKTRRYRAMLVHCGRPAPNVYVIYPWSPGHHRDSFGTGIASKAAFHNVEQSFALWPSPVGACSSTRWIYEFAPGCCRSRASPVWRSPSSSVSAIAAYVYVAHVVMRQLRDSPSRDRGRRSKPRRYVDEAGHPQPHRRR